MMTMYEYSDGELNKLRGWWSGEGLGEWLSREWCQGKMFWEGLEVINEACSLECEKFILSVLIWILTVFENLKIHSQLQVIGFKKIKIS